MAKGKVIAVGLLKAGDIFEGFGRTCVCLGLEYGRNGSKIRFITPGDIPDAIKGIQRKGGGIRISRRNPAEVRVIGKHPTKEFNELLEAIKERREAYQEKVAERLHKIDYVETEKLTNGQWYEEVLTLANGSKVVMGDHVMVEFTNGTFECLVVGTGVDLHNRQLHDKNGRIGVLDIRYGYTRSRPQYVGAEYIKKFIKHTNLEENWGFKSMLENASSRLQRRRNKAERRDMFRFLR